MLSLIWVFPGFVFFEFADIQWSFVGFGSLVFFAGLCAWWGIGLLLAISGLRSGVRRSILASVGTALCFLLFLLALIPG
jgi:hypothetical protein